MNDELISYGTPQIITPSKISNNGTTNSSIYLLIKIQYYNESEWIDETTIIDDTTTRELNSGDYIALDAVFREGGSFNTSTATHGDGTYRVYVAVTDPSNKILTNLDGNQLVATYNFTISANRPPTTPELVSPENEEVMSDTTPFFDWTESTDPDEDPITYELQVDNNAGFSSPEIQETSLLSSHYEAEQSLALGTYYWRVRAYDGTEYSDWSTIWSFTISDLTPPDYSSDTDDSEGNVIAGTDVNITTKWNDTGGLSQAILRVKVGSGNWTNISSCQFNGESEGWCNKTIETLTYGGETVCWVQWASDLNGNWNTQMSEHCFNVTVNTPPVLRSVRITPGYPTRAETLTCRWKVIDNEYDTIYTNVTWYRNGSVYGSTTTVTCLNTSDCSSILSASLEKGGAPISASGIEKC